MTSRSSTRTGPAGIATGSAGACTEVWVSRTSWMRPADTVARGIIIAMKVAIITDMRIWMR